MRMQGVESRIEDAHIAAAFCEIGRAGERLHVDSTVCREGIMMSTRTVRLRALAMLAAGVSALGMALPMPEDVANAAPPTPSCGVPTFDGTGYHEVCHYTGAMQTFTVPAGVYVLRAEVVGAAGAHGTGPLTESGAAMQVSFDVTPGEVLAVAAGQHGTTGPHSSTYGGGGAGGPLGASGGGGTFVFDSASAGLLLAAGGGGGFGNPHSDGGAGGLVGADGIDGAAQGTGGRGATQSAGGVSPLLTIPSSDGSGPATLATFNSTGGRGHAPETGGGGGGYYGGSAGGPGGGGGGGSSFVSHSLTLASTTTFAQGALGADGLVTFGWDPPTVTIDTAPTSGFAGSAVSDQASLTFSDNPGFHSHLVTFSLYGPTDPSCSATPFATVASHDDFSPPQQPKTALATSPGVHVTVTGIYHWVVTYTDPGLGTFTTGCGEPTRVFPADPAILMVSPSTATIGYGAAQAYTVSATDIFGNPTEIPGTLTYSITGSGRCTSAVCTGPVGSYTVTAHAGPITGSAALSITKGASLTTVTVTPSTPAVNQPVTFTAQVGPVAPATTTPTGTVSFFLDGSSTPLATVPLVNGVASVTTTLGGGSHTVIAVYSGDGNYLASRSNTGASATEPCTTTITGIHAALVLTSGTTCLVNAHITGGITVANGAVLDVESSPVDGSITAHKAGGLRICGSHSSSVTVVASTGGVLIGDAAGGCAVNTIAGGVALIGNTGGLTVVGNTVTGSITSSANSGAGPILGQTAPVITGNHH